ncbi:putative metabolite transport protein CsbC [Cellulomonas sp. T2.31MG-18]|uniref:MFS transporter n=1 Tax=Cellulomonas sp. T2.31MG-18 TaxID=3157619 RepID=UPI0035F06FDE
MGLQLERNEALAHEAISHVIQKYSPTGKRIGWMMIASIFIEAWDLYSISFLLIFLKQEFHPSALMLGFTAAGTQAGAVVGALIGGWLSDRFGRRKIFLSTMVMFIVLGLAQAFAPSMAALAAIRLLLGIPLGSDLAAGYTYIMESMEAGKREVMGNRWQAMFGIGEVVSIGVITAMFGLGVAPHLLWRIGLGLGALPALALLLLRLDLPETSIWLIQKGRFREAKAVTLKMYDDPLDMLPDTDVEMDKPKLTDFLRDIMSDRTKRRATIFSWVASWAQALEFSTFAFYLPIMFVLVGVSGIVATNFLSMGIYLIAVVSGLVGPQLLPRIGQRRLSIYGFSIVLVSLLVAAFAIESKTLWLVPVAAAAMLWGHYWDAENVMTIPSMVAAPRQKGLATGFAYIHNKLPAFIGIFLFPTFFGSLGQARATLFTAVFPLVGLMAAVFILPEVYGYVEVRSRRAGLATVDVAEVQP